MALLEAGLSATDRVPAWMELPDYGDVLGHEKPGGFLRPDLDLEVIGNDGPARFVTNSLGFRNRAEPGPRPEGNRRVLLVGDSFVAGYRTDQERTAGRLLERRLSPEDANETEVWIVEAGHPAAYARYVEQHASSFAPDLVAIGITVGNDIAAAYATRNGLLLEEGELANTYLPQDAYKSGWAGTLPLRLHRSLHGWRSYRMMTRTSWPEGIGSWFRDLPMQVHLFDGIHGLGIFYSGGVVPQVEAAWSALEDYLAEAAEHCAAGGFACLFVSFPQRYQVNEREWRAVAFQYALDDRAFDRSVAGTRFEALCRRHSLECLDLEEAFRERSGTYYLPGGDMHWNEAGHELAAERIAAHITQRSLLVE